jgi:hypothetical protein
MKPKTFFKFSLFFPYILWGICVLIAYLISTFLHSDTVPILETLLIPVMFYAIGILFWFIPYTLLAIGLLIWSRHKSIDNIYRASIRAPLLLLILMVLEAVVLSVGSGGIGEIIKSTLEESLLLGGCSLVFGYLCVGIALGLYRFLRSKDFIKEEETINAELSLAGS